MERNSRDLRVVVAALATVWGAPVSAQPLPANSDAMVTVRTYNYAQVADESLTQARRTVETIFSRARISLQWIDCRIPQSDGAECTDPLQAGRDLMLRVMEGSREESGRSRSTALATSMLDHQQQGGTLMTVSLLPIRTIAAQASTDFATLLGRTIAHEMGHLLLGMSDHPKEGLMRARWLQDELRGLKPAHWGFSAREAARMRDGLLTRSRVAN